jgi:hypothetical protein
VCCGNQELKYLQWRMLSTIYSPLDVDSSTWPRAEFHVEGWFGMVIVSSCVQNQEPYAWEKSSMLAKGWQNCGENCGTFFTSLFRSIGLLSTNTQHIHKPVGRASQDGCVV